MNIPEGCDFPDCDCPGPERCQKEREVRLKPGWLMKDVQRASERLTEWRDGARIHLLREQQARRAKTRSGD